MTGALRGSKRFAEIRRSGYRAGRGPVVVYALMNGTARSRLGMAVPRRGGAVARNRVRRWIRAALRGALVDHPGLDVVVSTGPGVAERGYGPLEADLRSCLGRLAGRLEHAASSDS